MWVNVEFIKDQVAIGVFGISESLQLPYGVFALWGANYLAKTLDFSCILQSASSILVTSTDLKALVPVVLYSFRLRTVSNQRYSLICHNHLAFRSH